MCSVTSSSASHLAQCSVQPARLCCIYLPVRRSQHPPLLRTLQALRPGNDDDGTALPVAAPSCPATASTLSPFKAAHKRGGRRRRFVSRASSAKCPGDSPPRPDKDEDAPSSSYDASAQRPGYTLEDTRTLVETAMLAAVSGLAYLLSTILKLENSLGYFLPLPVVLAALRGGAGAGWRTMGATCFLLVVLLGPLRALSYFFLHGLLAASLGAMWKLGANFWLGIVLGAVVRMGGQLSYLVMSSVTMNENMFALLLSNVYNLLDNVTAAMGITGAPSPLVVSSLVFSLLLVNGLIYCFLVHVVYRVLLNSMGYKLGPLPDIVNKYLYAGTMQQQQQQGLGGQEMGAA
ncbi:hypothetical protein Agub_g12635 [Astrephomene gubernaculifera]|uniref:DUF2232 domain-containing protein n=1 Tax=Astrephomene gubernaculifera TaxID=47775 RepID=A0AAD3HRG0_9CHLO|nr:hypothetical protein Agub_g12635 [Astrephomene gubernaculifera]